jgi:hypothetical protein
MINIITYQTNGNKSKNNLSMHHQAYVYEGFISQQPSHALWSCEEFLHTFHMNTCTHKTTREWNYYVIVV